MHDSDQIFYAVNGLARRVFLLPAAGISRVEGEPRFSYNPSKKCRGARIDNGGW
jgi:hypothetical protein